MIDYDTKQRVIETLLTHGWWWEGEVLYAPRRTVGLTEATWDASLERLLDEMRRRRGRLERMMALSADADGTIGICLSDIGFLIEVLEAALDEAAPF